MKYIQQFFSWLSILIFGQPLRFESNTPHIYESRRQRKQREWEENHPWTAYWKGMPWYKWSEHYGTACSVYAKWLKNK